MPPSAPPSSSKLRLDSPSAHQLPRPPHPRKPSHSVPTFTMPAVHMPQVPEFVCGSSKDANVTAPPLNPQKSKSIKGKERQKSGGRTLSGPGPSKNDVQPDRGPSSSHPKRSRGPIALSNPSSLSSHQVSTSQGTNATSPHRRSALSMPNKRDYTPPTGPSAVGNSSRPLAFSFSSVQTQSAHAKDARLQKSFSPAVQRHVSRSPPRSRAPSPDEAVGYDPEPARFSRSPPLSRGAQARPAKAGPSSRRAIRERRPFTPSPGPGPSRRPPPINLEDLKLMRTLGQGGVGAVVLTQLDRESDHPLEIPTAAFATKYVNKDLMERENWDVNAEEQKNAERAALVDLPWNPHVGGIIAAHADDVNYYLHLELLPGGSLHNLIRAAGPMTTNATRFYFANIVLALDYLHSKGWIHRDVKPDNILMGMDGYLCVIDFTFAKKEEERDADDWVGVGTPLYTAPEVAGQDIDAEFGRSIDWWAAGCVLYEILTSYHVFVADTREKVHARILKGKYRYPEGLDVHPDAKDLIARLLEQDPSKRLGRNGTREVMAHPFLKRVDWSRMKRRAYPAPYVPPKLPVVDVNQDPAKLPKPEKVPGLRIRSPPRQRDDGDPTEEGEACPRPSKRRRLKR
ncbi:kinase-like protein [Heliocybe sulcata]|uniref:Kinase-like protein n=1 Tax=Heliocybe sulcata TaxID=5364 RepID=A0A5C3NHW0_9AGAM|nr:kinase-like protein [Heliocybe sulcata]